MNVTQEFLSKGGEALASISFDCPTDTPPARQRALAVLECVRSLVPLRGAVIDDADFEGLALRGNFKGTRFERVRITDIDEGHYFAETAFSDCNFEGASIRSKPVFHWCSFSETSFANAEINKALFDNCNFFDVDFAGTDLAPCRFDGGCFRLTPSIIDGGTVEPGIRPIGYIGEQGTAVAAGHRARPIRSAHETGWLPGRFTEAQRLEWEARIDMIARVADARGWPILGTSHSYSDLPWD